MKNYANLRNGYPPQPSTASADNSLLGLHNSSYHAQPHPIIGNYELMKNNGCTKTFKSRSWLSSFQMPEAQKIKIFYKIITP